MPNYQNKIIESSMRTIRNLPKEASVSQKKGKNGTIPKESLLNRCLRQVERLSKQIPSEERKDHPLLKEAWDVYFFLQNFHPIVGESQHWRPGEREVYLEDMNPDLMEELGSRAVESNTAEVYSGGLGFKHVNWDSNYLMAQPKHGHDNPYWRPDNAKKAGEGMISYTQADIDRLSGKNR